jgi:hypothetical protein
MKPSQSLGDQSYDLNVSKFILKFNIQCDSIKRGPLRND